jgi:hypothetical protein
MNAPCVATYALFVYAECKSPQLMRVALTLVEKSRPMLDSESSESF